MSKIAKLVLVCGISEEITYLGCIIYAIAKQCKHTHQSEQTPTVHSPRKIECFL